MSSYKYIIPQVIDDPLLPNWYDTVTIGSHQVTIDPRMQNTQQTLAVLPSKSKSGDSIEVLLQANAQTLLCLAARYAYSVPSAQEANIVRPQIKSILENYRSILDYLAHDMAFACSPSPQAQLYFPIAREGETVANFESRFARDFPGLRQAAPIAFDHIVRLQDMAETLWLTKFNKLVNRTKHRQLLPFEEIDCSKVIIHCIGIGVGLGELGFGSIQIADGGALRIVDAEAGLESIIRGPSH